MRLFISSGFSVQVGKRINELRAFAGPALGESVKWVEPENIHLTYAFLGEVAEETALAVIRNAMDAVANAFRRTDVVLGGFGAFPSLERPRVLWLGLKEGEQFLRAMALKLYEELAAHDVVSGREFAAHITLARVKRRLDPAALALVAAKAGELEVRDTVASIELMESRLSGAGPEYRMIYSSKLA